MESSLEHASVYGPLIVNAVKALAVLVVGWILAGFLSGLVRRRIVSQPNIDDTIGGFAASLVRWLVLLVTLIAVLQLFGIQATSLVAVLGAGTLAIGLALQGTLSDIAAGVMLIIFRPYKVGQFVDIGGTSGTVKDLNIFVTELVTPDNVQIILPNGQAWGAVITNFSAHATRRLDLTFGIDYGDDIDKAIEIILEAAKADERVHKDPESLGTGYQPRRQLGRSRRAAVVRCRRLLGTEVPHAEDGQGNLRQGRYFHSISAFGRDTEIGIECSGWVSGLQSAVFVTPGRCKACLLPLRS